MIITTPNKKHKLELYPARKDGVINSFAIKPTPIPDLAEEWN